MAGDVSLAAVSEVSSLAAGVSRVAEAPFTTVVSFTVSVTGSAKTERCVVVMGCEEKDCGAKADTPQLKAARRAREDFMMRELIQGIVGVWGELSFSLQDPWFVADGHGGVMDA